MALNQFQQASLEGPGSKPGLTGADLVEAKAEREMVAANKAAKTRQAQHPDQWPMAEAHASSDAAQDLSNIVAARKGPETPNPILARLMAFLASPRP